MIHENDVARFLQESNAIESIFRPPTKDEKKATMDFLHLDVVRVKDLEELVDVYAPSNKLRKRIGADVRIGSYYPPKGGPEIKKNLVAILMGMKVDSPWQTHILYESLHPFTDGNGRSGRALWLWQMYKTGTWSMQRLFLQEFYYQTLKNIGRPVPKSQ